MKCCKCGKKIDKKNYVFTTGKKNVCRLCFAAMVKKHGELKALRKLAGL